MGLAYPGSPIPDISSEIRTAWVGGVGEGPSSSVSSPELYQPKLTVEREVGAGATSSSVSSSESVHQP